MLLSFVIYLFLYPFLYLLFHCFWLYLKISRCQCTSVLHISACASLSRVQYFFGGRFLLGKIYIERYAKILSVPFYDHYHLFLSKSIVFYLMRGLTSIIRPHFQNCIQLSFQYRLECHKVPQTFLFNFCYVNMLHSVMITVKALKFFSIVLCFRKNS